MSKLQNYNSDCSTTEELEIDITAELQMFLDGELGLESGYELETDLSAIVGQFRYKYTAHIRLLDEAAHEFLDVFADNADELYDHLEFKFPRVKFNISLEVSDTIIAPEVEEGDGVESSDDPNEDDQDEDDEPTLEEQYAEEGLRVVDDIEETESPVFERGESEDEEDDDFEEEKPKRKKANTEEELEDIDLEEDDYVPDAEDREELWKAFGDFDEE